MSISSRKSSIRPKSSLWHRYACQSNVSSHFRHIYGCFGRRFKVFWLMWGMIYLFPRLFDAISDPLMGFISDNTKSKWGRRRQYVLIGGIIMGVAYIFMWQLLKKISTI